MAALAGGCLCGAHRYRITEQPQHAVICHCLTCRRAAGAQSVGWLTVSDAGFAWETSPPAAYASSPGITRTHCATCGSSLTYRSDPISLDVTLASLDDPESIPPQREVWLSHRLAWAPASSALPGFPERGGAA
jgi:hypothetical protein